MSTRRSLQFAILIVPAVLAPVFSAPGWHQAVLGSQEAAAPSDAADDQFRVAAHHYTQARWALAAVEFRAFLDRYPGNARRARAHFFLAESLAQVGDHAGAAEHLHLYLASGEEEFQAHALFRLSEGAFLEGRDDDARRMIGRFRETDGDHPLNAYALLYLGHLELRSGQPGAAEAAYAALLRDFADGVTADEARLGLGRAAEALQDWSTAERFYEHLASQEGGWSAEAHLRLGTMLYEQGDYDATIKRLESYLERADRAEPPALAWWTLGRAYLANRDLPRGLAILEQASENLKDHAFADRVWFSTAEALRDSGKAAEAAATFARIVEERPEGEWAAAALRESLELALAAGDGDRIEQLAAHLSRLEDSTRLIWAVRLSQIQSRLQASDFDGALQLAEDTEASVDLSPPSLAELEYCRGLAWLGKHEPLRALEALDRCHSGVPPSSLAEGLLSARAAALAAARRDREAALALQEYVDRYPDGVDAADHLEQLARLRAELGEFDAARHTLHRLHGTVREVRYLSAVQHAAERAYSAERWGMAREFFTLLAQEGNPAEYQAEGLAGLAWLEFRADRIDESASLFSQLIREYPNSGLAPEAAMMRARALERLQRFEAALGMYQWVLERFPTTRQVPAAMLGAARLLDAQGHDARAARLLKEVVDQYPLFEDRDAAMYQLAWVLEDLGEPERADRVCRRLLREFPGGRFDADVTYRLAERARRQARWQSARELAQRLIEEHPESTLAPYAAYLLGQVAIAEEDWLAAGTWMQQAGRGMADDEEFQLAAEYWEAEAHYQRDAFDEAARRFAALDLRVEGRTESWLAMIPLRRAQILVHAEDWYAAYDMATEIGSRFPDFGQQYEAEYVRGRCLAKLARFSEAREAFQRVIDSPAGARTETAAMAQWMIGETYFHQKNHEEAIRAYHRVESLYPYPRWQAAALLQAGKCHEMLEQYDDAAALYRLLISNYATTQFRTEAEQRLSVVNQRSAARPMPRTIR